VKENPWRRDITPIFCFSFQINRIDFSPISTIGFRQISLFLKVYKCLFAPNIILRNGIVLLLVFDVKLLAVSW